MTIELRQGDIFESGCEALVNPVNCVGTLGAGLAKQFRIRFPAYAKDYKRQCTEGKITTGSVTFFKSPTGEVILSFPTKQHWKHDSDYEFVELGMYSLVRTVAYLGVRSVAIPALGCGLGGLEWSVVQRIITRILLEAEANHAFAFPVHFILYEPESPRGTD